MSAAQVTLGTLVEFVLQNRKGNAFKDYHESTIASGIKRAADDGTMLYACEDDGSVVGVIIAFDEPETKTMHVHDFLAIKPWVFRLFLTTFRQRWSEHELTGLRRGKLMKYNTNKLVSKVVKGGI